MCKFWNNPSILWQNIQTHTSANDAIHITLTSGTNRASEKVRRVFLLVAHTQICKRARNTVLVICFWFFFCTYWRVSFCWFCCTWRDSSITAENSGPVRSPRLWFNAREFQNSVQSILCDCAGLVQPSFWNSFLQKRTVTISISHLQWESRLEQRRGLSDDANCAKHAFSPPKNTDRSVNIWRNIST